jgi:hypothetical protein
MRNPPARVTSIRALRVEESESLLWLQRAFYSMRITCAALEATSHSSPTTFLTTFIKSYLALLIHRATTSPLIDKASIDRALLFKSSAP